jgi:hypothetical protein
LGRLSGYLFCGSPTCGYTRSVFGRLSFKRLAGAVLAGAFVVSLGFPILYAAVVAEQRPALDRLPAPPEGTYEVFVVDWGYHTAVVVEQPPGWRLGPPGAESAPFLEYAWGDRAFYRDSDHRLRSVAATLVVPTASVLYLRGHPAPPRFAGADGVWARAVRGSTLRDVVHDLERTIRRTPEGARMAPERAPGFAGAFYPAHGSYLWTRGCNWWTVARLAGADLAEAPAGVVFTPQVPGRLRGFSRVPNAQ